MIRTEGVTKAFNGAIAVRGVNFEIEEGILASIIGPNGAGKTTFFNLLSGLYLPTEGLIYYEDEDITKLPAHKRIERGIGRTFQITSIFPELSVYENMVVAAQRVSMPFRPGNLMKFLFSHKEWSSGKVANDILVQTGLYDKKDELAGSLSHGTKQRLEIAMILTQKPKVLLLDESFAGLSVWETREQMEFVKNISENYTILLVEHKMDVVMELSDKVSVMNQGQIIAEGTPKEIKEDEYVKEVYLRGDDLSAAS